MLYILPSDIIDNNIADGQGLVIVLLAVIQLVLVTIMSGNEDGVFSVDELDMFETDIRDFTLTYKI